MIKFAKKNKGGWNHKKKFKNDPKWKFVKAKKIATKRIMIEFDRKRKKKAKGEIAKHNQF